MKIVIELPDDNYYDILQYAEIKANTEFENLMIITIKKGTPLPKGHGVLKDVTNLMRGLYTDIQTIEETFTSSDVYKMIDNECPTIIEADKTESEVKE